MYQVSGGSESDRWRWGRGSVAQGKTTRYLIGRLGQLFSCSVGYRAATSEPLFRRFRRGMDAPLEGLLKRRRSRQACHSKEQAHWVNLIATRFGRKHEKA